MKLLEPSIAGPGAAIRKLFAAQEPLFRDHLLRLDTASRHDRFLSAVSDGFLIEYAQRCFDSHALVLGFLQGDAVRAAGELHVSETEMEKIGEVGFSVEQDFRGKGIGSAMLRRLIVSARNRGLRHLRMNCHAQNLAMQAIARKFKAELRIEHGATVGDLVPEPATPMSLLSEALGDAREIAQVFIRLRQRRG